MSKAIFYFWRQSRLLLILTVTALCACNGTPRTQKGRDADRRYHTLLLKEGKVAVIGNPSASQKVRTAYNRALKVP